MSCERLVDIVGVPRSSLSGLDEGYGCLIEASSNGPMVIETMTVASIANNTWR